MKVLHVSTNAAHGGAAIAMQRLHRGLLASGADSMVAACSLDGGDARTIPLGGKVSRRIFLPARQVIESRLLAWTARLPQYPAYTTFSLLPSLRPGRINAVPKDILHLHWVNAGCLTPFDIARLNTPLVWTMHDAWPFTGGCHYFDSCERYRESCGTCTELCSVRKRDLSFWHWRAKQFAYNRVRPVFISPSRAYAGRAKESGLLSALRVEIIPNAVDTDIFKPTGKRFARNMLNLSDNATVLLFSTLSATSDRRKGFDLLVKALRSLYGQGYKNILCLVLGAERYEGELPYPTHFLGTFHDAFSLALAYSASDVFVCPSRAESFSLTCLEALSCGTPVAAFSVGGIPDMVEDGVNGYLAATHEDPSSLAQAISKVLDNPERSPSMSAAAREKAVREHSLQVIAGRHIALYQDILTAR